MTASRTSRLAGTALPIGLLVALLATAPAAWSAAAPARPAAKAEDGIRWRNLAPGQRSALKPLERDWQGIDANRKQKWLEIADRFPSIGPAEQARIQERMTAWAKMTPEQRGQVRLQFQEAQRVAPQDRQAQWQAYQALPEDKRQQLAARAAPPAAPPAAAASAARDLRKPVKTAVRTDKPARDAGEPKSNIVPNPGLAAPPKPVAPTVVQAASGASTTLITKRPYLRRTSRPACPRLRPRPGM